MKVLAIRGRNLASLSGPFEVDFQSEPLASAGLFAITGPTGAGKSTLLDALCLALFDKTPRLDARGGPAIGVEGDVDRLVANDVRSLMSQGATEAMAEVDFLDREAKRWRATWTVKRARGAATGRVQRQDVGLVSLDTGQALGGTKMEILQAIESKLGLTFDQFCKSVLLAQGDFADFLKADADDRSTLLQRLTGTEIYEAISKKAHERAKVARERRTQLETTRDTISILEQDARVVLESEIEQAEVLVRELEHRVRTLEELGRTETDARIAEDQAREQAELKTVAEQVATEAETRKAAATRSLQDADAALETLSRENDALKPEIDRARELDSRVTTAESEFAATSRRAQEAERGQQEAARALAICEETEEKVRGRLTAAEDWMEANAGSRELAERWRQVDETFAELTRIETEMKAAQVQMVAAEDALECARRTEESAAAKFARLEKELQQAVEDRRRAEKELALIPVAELRARLESLAGWDRGLAPLVDLPARVLNAEAERGQAEEGAATSRDAARRAAGDRTKAAKVLEQLAAQLPEAQEAVRVASAALSLADRRADLVPGKPCPLCGSLAHPWASAGAPSETLLSQYKKRIEELEKKRQEQHRKSVRAEATAEHEARMATSEEKRAQQRKKDVDALTKKWEDALELLASMSCPDLDTLPHDPLQHNAEHSVQAVLENLRVELDSIRESLEEAEQIEHSATKLRARGDALTVERDGERVVHEKTIEAVRKASQLVGEVQGEIRNRSDASKALIGQLQFVLGTRPELRHRLEQNLQGVRLELEEEASTYRNEAEAAGAGRVRLNEAEKRTIEARASLVPIREQTTTMFREASKKQKALAELQHQREAVLGGQKVSDVEARQRTRHSTCEQERQDAQRAVTEASEKSSSARMAAELAATGAEEAKERSRTALERVTTDRNAAGVSSEDGAAEGAKKDALAKLGEARRDAETKRTRRHVDDNARTALADLTARIQDHTASSGVWLELDELIGSADGKKFRTFVQSLTLEALIQETNYHLRELARRYRLERVPNTDMDLQVVDSVLGDERRAVQSLSGGETFLVSLGLALGLSSLATQRTRIETMFVDEGFGTLDAETLDKSLTALEALQATGRRVGIISHIAALTERIGTRVLVTPKGAGRSGVNVVGIGA